MFIIYKSIIPKDKFWDLYNQRASTMNFYKKVKTIIDVHEIIKEIEHNFFYNIYEEVSEGVMKFYKSNLNINDNPIYDNFEPTEEN